MGLELFSDEELDQKKLEEERSKQKEDIEKRIIREKNEKVEDETTFVADKKLYVIDGYSLIYRSYFAFLSHPLTDGQGHNMSAYFGFFNTLLALISQYGMDYLAVTMDEKEPTFRHNLYPEYKANRDRAPEDLHAQVPLIKGTLEKMGVKVLSKPGYEADDVIASLTRIASKNGVDTVMFTGDKDLLQLVGEHVSALRPPKKGERSYSLFKRDEVYQEFGVYPEQIIDYLSLIGDSADNIPGVKGIGEKGAVKLLAEFVSIEGIYRKLDRISANVRKKLEDGKASAELSKVLITLSFDALDEDFNLEDLSLARIRKENAKDDFIKYGQSQLVKKIGVRTAEKEIAAEAKPTATEDRRFLGKGSYRLLTDIREIEKHFEQCIESHGAIMAFDTETTGLEIDSSLVGFSFSYELKKAYYCPLLSQGKEYLSLEDVVALFKKYFSSGKIRLVGQNLKYDLEILQSLGIGIAAVHFDTMLASWLLESDRAQFNLDDLASRYLDYATIRYEDVVSQGCDFSDVPIDKALDYGAEDSDLAYRLYVLLEGRLAHEGLLKVMDEIELPLIKVLVKMEMNGISLSDERMEALKKDTDEKVAKLEKDIYADAGHVFNINSTQQLAKVLFEEKGLKAGKKTKSGYSTDVDTLESLRSTGEKIITDILDFRLLSKLKSTYIDVLPTLKGNDGRIHTSFLQTGTATGRLSSRNPNLQNIPVRTAEGRMIRSAFLARPGYTYISADYSQIELVVLAHMSSDPELCKAFRSGEDVHRYTAGLVFNKDVSEVTADERRIAKTINFGIMYGMSAFRLSNELGISRSDAAAFIDRYFERYGAIRKFVEKCVKKAEEDGAVTTLFGHRRRIPGIRSVNKTEKKAAERVAVNTVIQGTASEVMKRAMLSLDSDLLDCLVLQVHDELIFEVPIDAADEMAFRIKKIMESSTSFSVPIKASVEIAECWGDMH